MVEDPEVYMLRNGSADNAVQIYEGPPELSLDPRAIRTGQNSGYQVMNIATLAGAARIVLLGYDCQAKDARSSHWFGDHPEPTPLDIFKIMRGHFSKLAPVLVKMGIEVINCTPGTALDCFRKQDIASVFPDSPGAVVSA